MSEEDGITRVEIRVTISRTLYDLYSDQLITQELKKSCLIGGLFPNGNTLTLFAFANSELK